MSAHQSDASAIDEIAAALVAEFRRQDRTIATAESLTGGLIGSLITGVPGASSVYRGGIIAYSADVKKDILGVSDEACSRGLISEEVAVQMAIGAYKLLGSDIAVSCTGVAGPDSDHSGPRAVDPGTIWIAVASDQILTTKLLKISGSRHEIRLATAHEALMLVSQQ